MNKEILKQETNKSLFEKLDRISDTIFNIDVKVKSINEKLDELIAALHAYDDDQLEWPEPNDALKEAAAQYNEKVLNERMDIIGQNGNNGDHYDADEFDDYGKRVVEDKDNNNNPAKHVGEKKRNSNPSRIDGFNKRKYYNNNKK
jgi:hypothetical protein